MTRNDEYEYQFWEFSIKELCIGLRKVIEETIQLNVTSLKSSAEKRLPEEKRPALASSCQTLQNEYVEEASKHLNTVESYIQENFQIPPHILLKEDSVQRNQYSDQDKENLEREIKELSQRINRVHFLEYHLTHELEKIKEMKTSEKVKELTLPDIHALPSSRNLHQIMSECLGLEVEEANCHLQSGDLDEASDINQPNFCVEVCQKKRRKLQIQNV